MARAIRSANRMAAQCSPASMHMRAIVYWRSRHPQAKPAGDWGDGGKRVGFGEPPTYDISVGTHPTQNPALRRSWSTLRLMPMLYTTLEREFAFKRRG